MSCCFVTCSKILSTHSEIHESNCHISEPVWHTLRIGCTPNIFTLFSSVSVFYIRKSSYEANPSFAMLFSVFQVPTVCHSGVILVVNWDQIMWERMSLCVDGSSTSGFTHQTLFRTEFSHRSLKQNKTLHHILTLNCWGEKSIESIYLFLFWNLSFWHIMERMFDCFFPQGYHT